MVVAAIHGRTHQVIKARINQHEVARSHLFHATHLSNQHARFRHQETTRFNFELHRMPHMRGNFVAGGAPQAVIVIGIDRLFPFTIRNGKTATGGDRLQILTEVNNLAHHRAAHLLQVPVIDAGANVHMNAYQLQAVALQYLKRGRHIGIPDPVLAVFAPGVGFLAMAVAKARVDAQPDAMTG